MNIAEIETTANYLPEVSFDIRLGKSFSNIEFDYEKYSELLETLSSEVLEESSVKKPAIVEPATLLVKASPMPSGSFNFIRNQITVDVPFYMTQRANQVLTHEAQHSTDYSLLSQSRPELFDKARIARGNIATLAALSGDVLAISSLTSNAIVGYGEKGAIAGLSVALVSSAVMVKEYMLSEVEVRARKAAKKHSKSFEILKFEK